MLCCQSFDSSGWNWNQVDTNQANFQLFSYVFLFIYRGMAHIPDKKVNREIVLTGILLDWYVIFISSKWIHLSDKQTTS